MDDGHLNEALDRLVPAVAVDRWDDVIKRARRLQRRRDRRRRAVILAMAAALVLAAALAASGQIGSLLPHSKEPHLLLRGQVRAPDGVPVGSVQIELHRAAVSFGRSVALWPWGRHTTVTSAMPARWFLDLKAVRGDVAEGSLYARGSLADGGSRLALLCAPCRTRDSGRIELSPAQAYALVNGDVVLVLTTDDRERIGQANVQLDRDHLRRGSACWYTAGANRECTRIYTGLP